MLESSIHGSYTFCQMHARCLPGYLCNEDELSYMQMRVMVSV